MDCHPPLTCYNYPLYLPKSEQSMSYDKVQIGENVPDDINVVIEIPALSDPIKYEVDKDSGTIMVDRFMSTCMHYPCNYGYVPKTLCDDGDPIDVLVITPYPLMAGSVIAARPVGLLRMTDEKGSDAKILAVPVNKLSKAYHKVNSYEDLPESTTEGIAHFFEHYKDLEPGKWVNIDGWYGPEEAKAEIVKSIEMYNE